MLLLFHKRSLFVFAFILMICFVGCEELLDNDTTKSDIAYTVDSLTQSCWSMRESNTDSSIVLGEQALRLAEQYGLSIKIPRVANYIGVVYLHYKFDSRRSISYFHKALELSLASQDSIQMGYAYNNLGDALMLIGNPEMALYYSEKSLAIFKEIGYAKGIAYGYINLGLAYRRSKEFEKSIDFFNQAKSIWRSLHDSLGLASLDLQFGRVYEDMGNLDSSMFFYQRSYKLHKEISNYRYVAHCLNGMAMVNYEIGNYHLAFDQLSTSLDYNQQRNQYNGQIDDLNSMALVLAKLGKPKQGKVALAKALDLSTKLGFHEQILKTYQNTALFYKVLNHYEEAIQSFEVFLTVYDSILSNQQSEILKEAQDNFAIGLRLNDANQQLSAKSIERKYLIVILLLLIVLVAFIVWRLNTHSKLTKALKASNRTKDKLFSVISHDLKSPYNSIMGFSEILLKNLKNKQYQHAQQYAEYVFHAAEDSLRLLNNLLNWSRAQTGRIVLSTSKTDINELFIQLKSLFEIDAERNKVKMEFECKLASSVLVDTNIVRVVLVNLLSNALKYTPIEGNIYTKAEIIDNSLVVKVRDTGIGMADKTLNSVLDKLQTVVSTKGLHEEQGTGLGLLVCLELVQIHHGTIKVQSELGVGTEFIVEFQVG